VTVIAGVDGDTFDVLESTARGGVHTLRTARSYLLDGGALRLVSTRNLRAGTHR
jgi:hypothetical protein